MDRVDCIIAGAGVIGLAIGRALALTGREVVVIERNGSFGLETSGRNSEVIHAGIYYPPASLKARFCREGRALLVDYLASKSLPHRLCGKLIVASGAAQEQRLKEIEANARASGVTSLVPLSPEALHALEPELAPAMALHSPETGIFDSHAYMQALLDDMEAAGGTLALQTEIRAVRQQGEGFTVETQGADGAAFTLACSAFVNAAGLGASALAQRIEAGSWTAPETRYARGAYYQVEGSTPFTHLVYPVPEPGGLGIHLTLDMAGNARFGPDVEWIDSPDYALDDSRRAHFESAIARYWPGVAARNLYPAYCGIRPKIVAKGEPDADFMIAGPETHGVRRLVQLFGIESPGLTASLAIANDVMRRLGT